MSSDKPRSINIISSVTADNIIGIRGRYHDAIINSKKDKKLFAAITRALVDGQAPTLIIGRKTYESLPLNMKNGTDPRHYIVLSRGGFDKLGANTQIMGDLSAAMRLVAGRSSVWVIGGAQIFESTLEYVQENKISTYLYLTRFKFDLEPLIEDSAVEIIRFTFDIEKYKECDKWPFVDDLRLLDCEVANRCPCEFILYQISPQISPQISVNHE
jgi:dihydrofolate reductase